MKFCQTSVLSRVYDKNEPDHSKCFDPVPGDLKITHNALCLIIGCPNHQQENGKKICCLIGRSIVTISIWSCDEQDSFVDALNGMKYSRN